MPPNRPKSVQEVCDLVRAHAESKTPLPSLDISELDAVLELSPNDLTIAVEAGMSFAKFQESLATENLWLPLDPHRPEKLTLADLIHQNAYGPSRLGYGTVRDYLIGGRFVMADGETIKSGSSVVKNVAGFDLLKLFIGAKGCLGIPVELIFKTLPLPQKRTLLELSSNSFESLQNTIDVIWDKNLSPTRLDVYGPSASAPQDARQCRLYIQFEGAEADVDWQTQQVLDIAPFSASDSDFYNEFFEKFSSSRTTDTFYALPSESLNAARALSEGPFLLHVGFGALLAERSHLPANPEPSGAALMRRAKSIFDPDSVFPNLEL